MVDVISISKEYTLIIGLIKLYNLAPTNPKYNLYASLYACIGARYLQGFGTQIQLSDPMKSYQIREQVFVKNNQAKTYSILASRGAFLP